MTTDRVDGTHRTAVVQAAVEAYRRGYVPVPIRDGGKSPHGESWTRLAYSSEEHVRSSFEAWADARAGGLGVLLGTPSLLLDVDLDNRTAARVARLILPRTPMRSGRPGNAVSHLWYRVDPLDETVPGGTKRYQMPDGSTSVELRSTGAQTLLPPSTWYPKRWDGSPETTEEYRWEGAPWGGDAGPKLVNGRVLAVQVAMLAMTTVLLDRWPTSGGRHDAYLALAGGLLRLGDGVHPFWERNLPRLVEVLADASRDEDGASARVSEVMKTTLRKLSSGDGKVQGWPRLAELIGTDHAEMARRLGGDVTSLSGYTPVATVAVSAGVARATAADATYAPTAAGESDGLVSTLPPEVRDPLGERLTPWDAVDLAPYLRGETYAIVPSILTRTDGKSIFYGGRVNSIFGLSESFKTWIAYHASIQVMGRGGRVVVVDLEDDPYGFIERFRALNVADDDINTMLRYVHPEGPLAEMQRYRFGAAATDEGKLASERFRAMLEDHDPELIVVDGMNALYGLHGHDTNEASATDVVTTWLKSLTRGGRTSVLVIDHTGKGGGAGASPMGSHHKVAMIQGTAIRVDVQERPRPNSDNGLLRLVVFKDRPGKVREFAASGDEQIAADVEVHSSDEEGVRMVVRDANTGSIAITASAADAMAAASRVVDNSEQVLALFQGDLAMLLSSREVMVATNLSQTEVYGVWEHLKRARSVVSVGHTRYRKYRLWDPSKDNVDPNAD